MADRPTPPNDSEESSEYAIGDQVYYFFGNEWFPGEIKREGGSSSGAKIWTVMTSQTVEYTLRARILTMS